MNTKTSGISTIAFGALITWATSVSACDLCAIYSANNARGEATSGFLFTATEEFISARHVQLNSAHIRSGTFLDNHFIDTSMAHFVVGYNVTPKFGVSASVPYVHRRFRRFEQRVSLTAGSVFQTEEGSVSGVGDMAIVGRWTVFQRSEMTRSISVNLMGGLKLPTGDTSRLKDEVSQEQIFTQLFGPNHQHFFSGVHQNDLTLGSGSVDGIMGIAANARWQRAFANFQAQYYLRTDGESGYRVGDELILSGGPGVYLLLNDGWTVSLQANAYFEMLGQDSLNGVKFGNTGMTATYFGPQLNFTVGEHFSAQAAVDLPTHIQNNGLMNVPDYRIRGGLTWRF